MPGGDSRIIAQDIGAKHKGKCNPAKDGAEAFEVGTELHHRYMRIGFEDRIGLLRRLAEVQEAERTCRNQ
jgi:hypothetical protein